MRIKRKRLLIYGKMYSVTLGETASNDKVVRDIRAELTEQEDIDVGFAMMSDSYNTLTLLFLYDVDEEILGGEDNTVGDFIRFLTGDGLPGVDLKYPICTGKDVPEFTSADRLNELYEKNNNFFGGDNIEDLVMIASPTMLKINIKFKEKENEKK